MYSDGHKHVTDVKLDSTVVLLNRIHAVVTLKFNIDRMHDYRVILYVWKQL